MLLFVYYAPRAEIDEVISAAADLEELFVGGVSAHVGDLQGCYFFHFLWVGWGGNRVCTECGCVCVKSRLVGGSIHHEWLHGAMRTYTHVTHPVYNAIDTHIQ